MAETTTKTAAELAAEKEAEERAERQRRIAQLRNEISDLETKLTQYQSFKSGINSLIQNLEILSNHIKNSYSYLDSNLVIDSNTVGKASMSETVSEISGYISTLNGVLPSITTKINELDTILTSKQNELRRLT